MATKKTTRAKPGPKPLDVKPEKVAVYLPPALAHAFRVQCAVAQLTHSEAAAAAIAAWLGGQGVKVPKA